MSVARYKQNSLTEGNLWKLIVLYFFPILIGTFFQQMYNTVDTIIVGRFVGTEALAAVGTTATAINLLSDFSRASLRAVPLSFRSSTALRTEKMSLNPFILRSPSVCLAA